jgi:nitrous oxidase accessory protein
VQLKGDGIKVWESNDAVVSGCSIDHVRDVVVWYSRRALLEHNIIRNSRYGTHFMYASDSVMRDSQVENDVVGVFAMYSSRLRIEHNVLAGARGAAGVGIGFKESDAVHVAGNAIVANTTGSYLDETPRTVGQRAVFVGNTFALNDVAVRFHGVGEGLEFTDNDFRENTLLADVEGGGDALSITFHGNHYSDYVGYDLDGDGVGDVAYQAKRLSNEIMDEHPALAFFQGTAAMGLVDAVANAMPVFASRVLLEDRAPRLRERPGP